MQAVCSYDSAMLQIKQFLLNILGTRDVLAFQHPRDHPQHQVLRLLHSLEGIYGAGRSSSSGLQAKIPVAPNQVSMHDITCQETHADA